MICALLDFEQVNPYTFPNALNVDLPTFRCKMPNLPSDVPSMMGFELLQVSITEDRAYVHHNGCALFLIDNAANCHNNTLTNEIYLTHLETKSWRWFPQLRGENLTLTEATGGVNTNQAGIVTLTNDKDVKSLKIYISTKQNYIYFKIEDVINAVKSNGYRNIVNQAKMIVRLTFDTRQNEYQPKKIML